MSERKPLNFGKDKKAVFLYLAEFSEADLEQDLVKLAKNPVSPVILILEEQEQRIDELRDRIDRNVPNVAPSSLPQTTSGLSARTLATPAGAQGAAIQP